MDDTYKKHWGNRLKKGSYQVPCRPISEMIEKAGIQEIHAFFLDVEGAEVKVLETFDWKIPVHVWVIEVDQHAEEIRKMLTSHSYVETEPIGNNAIFLHPDLALSKNERMHQCGSLTPMLKQSQSGTTLFF